MASGALESMAAGQQEQGPASPTPAPKISVPEHINDPPDTPPVGEENVRGDEPSAPAKKGAPRGKKRKADEPDSTTGTPVKKTKQQTDKTTTKPRQTKRTKKTAAEPPPPPPSPGLVELTSPVQAKIKAVKQFVSTEMAHENSMLLRCDPESPRRVSLPFLDLVGVIQVLYFHYQLGPATDGQITADVEEVAAEYFKKPVCMYGDVDWVTVDLDVATKLEQRIKEKIDGHGLEGVSLLEVEMELCARRNRARARLYEWEADRGEEVDESSSQAAAGSCEGMARKVEMELMKGQRGGEMGRHGVCPAPAIEVA